MAKVFVGMETSGVLRRAFAAAGHDAISCDLLPAEDHVGWQPMPAADDGRHWQGDVFAALDFLLSTGWVPDLAIFHPDCTYHTNSAAWAFADPDFVRYPACGYHQRVGPKTLVGLARRERRLQDEADVRRIVALPLRRKIIENPRGALTRILGPATQTVQPYEFGDDASKATSLWMFGDVPRLRPTSYIAPRIIDGRPRWANQTDSGQNRLSPSEHRWLDRARTYPGIAGAMARQIGGYLNEST